MAARTKGNAPDEAQAQRLEVLIRARGDYGHLQVRSRAGHLVIEACGQGGADPVARLTPLGSGQFGLSFHNHSGRWEPMQFQGSLEAVVDDMFASLGPFLERMDF